MKRQLLRAKVHRATVTEVDRDYEGSLGMDADLMEAARILPFERVEVYDISNGNRFATYAIPLRAGSGKISANGAAAHLVRPGDLVIIACYATLEEEEAATHRPIILQMGPRNRIRSSEPGTAVGG